MTVQLSSSNLATNIGCHVFTTLTRSSSEKKKKKKKKKSKKKRKKSKKKGPFHTESCWLVGAFVLGGQG